MLINLAADHRVTAPHPEMVPLHVSSSGIILRFTLVSASRFKAVSSLATVVVTPELPLCVLEGKDFLSVSVHD